MRSVVRALGLLKALGREGKTLTELAAAIDVSLSTASRLLATLRSEEFVVQRDDGVWIPGPQLASMLYTTDRWAGIRSTAAQATRALCTDIDETAAFFVLAGNERLCLESTECSRPVRRVYPPGERGPVYLGAAGKALLAFSSSAPPNLGLPTADGSFRTATGDVRTAEELQVELDEIRARGYAFSHHESTRESWSVAAPVIVSGRTIGTLAAIVPSTRDDDEYIQAVESATVHIASTFS